MQGVYTTQPWLQNSDKSLVTGHLTDTTGDYILTLILNISPYTLNNITMCKKQKSYY